MQTMTYFLERLQLAAEYAGVQFSQTAIARSLGIRRKQTVDRWFQGSEPRALMIFHIADTWGVSARWLATGVGDMVPPRRHVRVARAAVVALTLGIVQLFQPAPAQASELNSENFIFSRALYTFACIKRWLVQLAEINGLSRQS